MGVYIIFYSKENLFTINLSYYCFKIWCMCIFKYIF